MYYYTDRLADDAGESRGWGAAETTIGLAPAIAVPVAGAGISIVAVLEAVAFVLSALAAAYVLIQAYEFARSRGFGVAMAQTLLSAGLGRLAQAGRRLAGGLRRIIERARRIANPDPRCLSAIAEMLRVLAAIEQTLTQLEAEATSAVPRIPELRRLMGQLSGLMDQAKNAVRNAVMNCPRFMTP
jgi:hypothetical protein